MSRLRVWYSVFIHAYELSLPCRVCFNGKRRNVQREALRGLKINTTKCKYLTVLFEGAIHKFRLLDFRENSSFPTTLRRQNSFIFKSWFLRGDSLLSPLIFFSQVFIQRYSTFGLFAETSRRGRSRIRKSVSTLLA